MAEGESSTKRERSPQTSARDDLSPPSKRIALDPTSSVPPADASDPTKGQPSAGPVQAVADSTSAPADSNNDAVEQGSIQPDAASTPTKSGGAKRDMRGRTGRGGRGGRGDGGDRGRGGSGRGRGRDGGSEQASKEGHGERKRSGAIWGPRKDRTEGEDVVRLPKKKCAVLLGYCGTGYHGMQIQPDGAKTIEGEFFAALVKAGAVSSDNADDHRKVDVQRAARTDAGVHAAGNVISMKMILEPPIPEGFKDLAEYVNSFLPPTIRMWGFVRTVKSFQARLTCDSRKYEYVFPSYCLLPPSRTDSLALQLDASSPGWRDTLGAAAEFADAAEPTVKSGEGGEGEGDVDVDPRARGEYERRRGWRIDPGTMARFRDLVKEYLGTHNFHNYTVGKPFNDRTVKRYMIEINVRDPKVVGEIEWVSVSIHGQSFMLHQIRKMMSLAMLACRTGSPPALIPETYGPKRIHVPKAPPLGLLLEAPQFTVYNTRVSDKTNGLEADREPVDFGLYQAQIDEFKLKHIYDQLRADELQSHVFHKWIRQMDCAIGPTLSFLNIHGVIPPEAQLSLNKSKGNNKDAATDGVADDALQNEIQSEDEDVDEELLKRGELEG